MDGEAGLIGGFVDDLDGDAGRVGDALCSEPTPQRNALTISATQDTNRPHAIFVSALAQRVLESQAFLIAHYLMGCRLPDIDHGLARQMADLTSSNFTTARGGGRMEDAGTLH
jgi:hypothetical protein